MATVNIEERKSKKKGIQYRARVRVRTPLLEKGYYEESKTFQLKAHARKWANELASDLEELGIPKNKFKTSELKEVSLKSLIDMYLVEYGHELGRTKFFALKAIMKRDIAVTTVSTFQADDIIQYAKDRRKEGAGAYTVYQDILFIKSVIAVCREQEFLVNGDVDFIHEAIKKFKEDINNGVPKHKRLVEFSANERTEIPTRKEMELLRCALKEREEHRSAKIPFLQILDFAIASCMRISEICRIKWENFNEEDFTVVIEDRKHPTNKIGNHVEVPLVGGAYEIIMNRKMLLLDHLKKNGTKFSPKDRIFPFDARSVTAGWQRSRKKLIESGHNISNIRFHDLRAYGASLLMEQGWSLPQVSKVTGHRDWNVLNNIYNRLDVKKIAREDYERRQQEKIAPEQ